jgi:hypothetical protein
MYINQEKKIRDYSKSTNLRTKRVQLPKILFGQGIVQIIATDGTWPDFVVQTLVQARWWKFEIFTTEIGNESEDRKQHTFFSWINSIGSFAIGEQPNQQFDRPISNHCSTPIN